jgi:hypothetical protein
LSATRQYVHDNPARWESDRDNPQNGAGAAINCLREIWEEGESFDG